MKKNDCFDWELKVPIVKKLLRIMKLTAFLLLISVFGVLANKSYSQTLSLNMEKVTLKEVLSKIENMSHYNFMYSEKFIDVTREVSINVENKKIEDVLNSLFAGTDVFFERKDRIIILSRSEAFNASSGQQQKSVSGKVTDSSGETLPSVSVVVKGTTAGVITDNNGAFSLSKVPENATLVFSFVGMQTQEIVISGKTSVNVVMKEETIGLEEVVAVGYGTQKKSDITGTVASVGKERLELVPNLNIAQAIQGAMPGVTIQTTAGGAVADQSIMIRGRNSILASNDPLIVVDGIPYGGLLKDLNPNDVKSIEVLKDASAAAIYGSRGSNGVILISTKVGENGKPKISYNGYYSIQDFVKLPNLMNGEEFYQYKMERAPNLMSQSEKEIYASGKWVNWLDLALRNGSSTEHNLSLSGGFQNTKYYISGGVLNVKGLALNDDYLRLTSRINLDTKVNEWLTLGTRTEISYDDCGGVSPTWEGDQGVFSLNPLTKAYDENGKLTIHPWVDDPVFVNPLQGILAIDTDETNQILMNNYAIVTIPFISGLQYRINTGFQIKYRDSNTYYGSNTATGLSNNGYATTNRFRRNNNVIENIIDYNREFGKHKLFFTGLYSFESVKSQNASETISGFPHDFLTWYSAAQALTSIPAYSYYKTTMISQMICLNYSYNGLYLLTITGRRDGYSGFGDKTKWGIFPSIALGWNISKETFFPWKEYINELKLRASYGINGNQAVGAYETISRLGEYNFVVGKTTLAGYVPTKLGMDNLGWESTKSLNFGADFSLFSSRIKGDINYFKAETYDLLLNRTISPVHGITSITQNIGKTENRGLEATIMSRNIVNRNFQWITNANLTWLKNKIVSLYGVLDEKGNEIDDINNRWFIGQPIRVNYGYVWQGIWQLNEAETAALYNTQPGYIKIKDINNDGKITPADRQIVGRKDPDFLWGLTNTWSYKNLALSVFVHGVHGVTKSNPFLLDDAANGPDTRRNVTKKICWTPDNPNATHPINVDKSWLEQGVSPMTLEDASFIRIKDITLSYDLTKSTLNQRAGFNKLKIYFTGRNLFTFTKWTGLDPELDGQTAVPLQKEFVLGLNIGF